MSSNNICKIISKYQPLCRRYLGRTLKTWWDSVLYSPDQQTASIGKAYAQHGTLYKYYGNLEQKHSCYIWYSRIIATLWNCPALHPSPRGNVQHRDICGRVLVLSEAVLWCRTLPAPCSTSSEGVHCTAIYTLILHTDLDRKTIHSCIWMLSEKHMWVPFSTQIDREALEILSTVF
jgi:hypothetical protein